MNKIKVNLLYRKPYTFHYSIEKIFDGIINELHKERSIEIIKQVVPYYNNSILRRLKNIIWSSKNQFDINHITGDIHYIAIGLNKSKTILTIHDLYFLNAAKPLTIPIYYLLWLKLPLKKVSYITVVSETTKKEILKWISFPQERIKVIPNYVDPAFKPSPKQFSKKAPKILQIGTKENKNIPRLIQALEGISCKLTIIGKHETIIESLLNEKNISYDWKQNLTVSEIIEQYNMCDIVCFTSIEEGFGMPILEAQAVGRVVLTSNISSMPEVAGTGGYFVNPFSVMAIRDGIKKLINDDDIRNTLILNGFKNIKRYQLPVITNMYLNLYKELSK